MKILNKKQVCFGLFLTLLVGCVFTFTACGDDDESEVPVPEISLHEANVEGNILCVQADIKAPGRTQLIKITVIDQDTRQTKVQQQISDPKYIGVLNIDGFHVHVDIAAKDVHAGDVLQLFVADEKGGAAFANQIITENDDDD